MDPFVGEIRLLALSFPPQGWAFCQGQLMAIAQNTALFSLLGTMYGGDGRVTFGLPDLRGRAAVGMGQGPGLTPYVQGEETGVESVTLLAPEMPMHTHAFAPTMPVSTSNGLASSPANAYYAQTADEQYGSAPVAASTMAKDIISGITGAVGGNQAHENRMPFLVLNYAIALSGVYPPRQ